MSVPRAIPEKITIEEFIGNFKDTENELITTAKSLVPYQSGLELTLLKQKIPLGENEYPDRGSAQTISSLGYLPYPERYSGTDHAAFREMYGDALYRRLLRRNIILIDDISKFTPREDDLTNSRYIVNPTLEANYLRSLLHEFGHLIYGAMVVANVKKAERLEDELFDIDITNNVGELAEKNKLQHPGHPSYYSFFYAGYQELKQEKWIIIQNASETFADVFALRALGILNNPDPILKQKIARIDQFMADYQRQRRLS